LLQNNFQYQLETSLDAKLKTDIKNAEKARSYFIEGKKAWNELYGGSMAMARFWKYLALLISISCIILSGGVIWSTRQSHIVPYVVEVNKLGAAVPVRPADREYGVTKTILTHTIAAFIREVREVIGDPLAEKDALADVYSHLTPGSNAYEMVTKFIQGRNPYKIGKKISVTVKITAILWKSDSTALVQWNETAWFLDGTSKPVGNYEAYVQVKVVPPKTPNQSGFENNPLGIFVDRLSWTNLTE